MKIRNLAAMCALAAAAAPGWAYDVGAASTFSNLVWSFTSTAPMLSQCNQARFDGTGDLARSNVLVAAGALNCPGLGGAFGLSGSLYLATDGSMNLTVLAGGHIIACPRIVNWFGTCTILDGVGNQRGTGTIRLL